MRPAGADAPLHGVNEVERRPRTDAGLLVRRNVRHMKDAELGLEAAAASETALVHDLRVLALAKRLSVALGAAAEHKHIFAVGEVGLVCRQCRCRDRLWNCQQVKDDAADHRQSKESPPPGAA